MDIEPATARAGAVVVIISSGWTPGEQVTLTENGAPAYVGPANPSGRLLAYLSPGGEGYVAIGETGATSGKQAGGIFYVSPNVATVSALAIVPHAINPNGANFFTLSGTGFPANATLTLARNGAFIGTTTTDANGLFVTSVTPAAGGDSGAVYTAVDTGGTTMAGQSVEERADAGPGDQNQVRGFMARALVNAPNALMAWEGEGFVPGEQVNISEGGTVLASGNADANGAATFFLGIPDYVASSRHIDGLTSGRRAWVAARVDPRAPLVPSLIVAPGQVWGSGQVTAWYTQFTPNQSATMYVDGVSIGSAGVDGFGNGYGFPSKPTSGFVHYVSLVAANGQVAVGPMISLVNAPTFTPTLTPTLTRTPTPTSTPVPMMIVGHVIWQGLPAQPNPLQQMPVTLTLKLGNTEVNYPRQLTDSSGFFTVTQSLSPGTYQWRVKGNTYLASTGVVTVSNAPLIQVEMGLQKGGDFNGDNAVSITDFNTLRNNFGTAGSPPLGPIEGPQKAIESPQPQPTRSRSRR